MKYTFNNTQPKDAVKIEFIKDDPKSAGDYLAEVGGKQILRVSLPKGEIGLTPILGKAKIPLFAHPAD